MAKRPRPNNYFIERQKEVEREGDKRLNLVAGMAEKLGVDVFDKYGIEFAEPTETRAAPSIDPARPRALRLAYMRESEILLVQYRDTTIIEYAGVPPEMWQDLKATDSTGRYIDSSGIYGMPYKKVNKFQLPEEVRVLFS
jgi:KTSC domain